MLASRTRRFIFRLGLVVVLLSGLAGLFLQHRSYVAPRERFEQARVALRQGDLAAVEEAIWSLAGEEDFAAERNYLTAACMIQEGDLALGLSLLRQAAAASAEIRVDAMVLAGEALYDAGQPGEAQLMWTAAIETQPDAAEPHFCLGALYYDLGANQQALEHLELAARFDDTDPRPHRMLGQLFKEQARFGRAVEHFQESLRRAPQQSGYDDLLIEIAESQVKLHEYAAALETLQASPEGLPKLVLRGEALHGLGQTDQALEAVEEALRQRDDFFPALELKGTILLDRGDAEGAVSALSEAVEMHPKEYFARFKLVRALRRLGDEPRALEHEAKATELREAFDRFLDMRTTAIEQPDNADLRYQLGLLAEQLNFPAEHWYRAAVAVDPTHVQALAKLREGSAN